MNSNLDSLENELVENINKRFNKYKVAYFLGKDSTPSDVKEWVGTGSSLLDLAISNRPHGGLPVGRIVELNGLESSGKSLICAHILAETQKKDGVAVYIDTENALSVDFLKAVGVDLDKMVHIHLDSIEEIFEVVEQLVETIRKSNKDRLVTIVVDSLSAASTKNEIEGDYDKEGWATDKAILLSKAMRKITSLIGKERILLVLTNQLRTKLGVMFGDKWTTSGGKAVPFHCSVRIRLKTIGQIKIKIGGIDQIVGVKVRAQVIKNRVGPPFRTADFEIYFDQGIDNYSSWLDLLKDHKLVKQNSSWYSIENSSGEEKKFQAKDFENLLEEDEELKEKIYNQICDVQIMKYKSQTKIGGDVDNIEVVQEIDEE